MINPAQPIGFRRRKERRESKRRKEEDKERKEQKENERKDKIMRTNTGLRES
jgi:hypothetical protein